MQIRESKNKTFLPIFERHEPLVADSTAMSTAKDCLRKYFYRHVLGFSNRDTPIYFIFGSAVHKFADEYHKHIENNDDAPTTRAQSILSAVNYYNKRVNPTLIAPGSKFDFMTLDRLMLSCDKLYDFFEAERAAGQVKVIASEQVLNTMLPDHEQIGGRSDQIVRWRGQLWGRDFKTTSKQLNYYDRTLEPNDQFTRYTYIQTKIAGERVSGQLVLVIRNTKKEGPEIQQFMTSRTSWQMAQWEKEQIHWNRILELCRESDTWPQQEKNCSWCEFAMVCKSGNEEATASLLRAQFVQAPWDFTSIEVEE